MRDYREEKQNTIDYIMEFKKMTRKEIKMRMPAEMEKYLNESNGLLNFQRHKHIIELHALKQLANSK